jgi:hypothetical protein
MDSSKNSTDEIPANLGSPVIFNLLVYCLDCRFGFPCRFGFVFHSVFEFGFGLESLLSLEVQRLDITIFELGILIS